MRLKPLNLTLPLLLALLLPACATTKPAAPVAAQNASAPAAEEDVAAKADEAKLPKVALTPEIFYGVLAGEIAAQRGGAGSAGLTYLDLAKQTRDPRLAQRAAEFCLLSGQLKPAIESLKLWIELDPDSLQAREQLFVALMRSGNLQESQPLLEDLLKREPSRAPAAFVQLARLSSKQNGGSPESYRVVSELAARYPDLPEARFAVLAAAADNNDQAAVQRELDKLAQIAPKWDLPVAWQVDRLRRADVSAAVDFLKNELARRPDAGMELQAAYPRLLVAAKRFAEARVAFESLLLKQPDSPDLLYATGLLAYQMRDVKTAQQRLQAALQRQYPEQDFVRYTLGQIAEESHEPAKAMEWYRQIGPGAQYLPAQSRLAILEAGDGQLEAALNRLGSLGSSEQEKTSVALLQSQLARDAGKPQRAYELLTQALKAQPKSGELLYERSLVSDMLGNVGNSERDLRQILKDKPDDTQALNALGYTLANRTTRYREALGFIEKALKAEPENPVILDSMGWVQFKLGKLEAARKNLEKAYYAMPDPEVAAHLGEVLWKLGLYQEAQALWDRELSSHPGHEVITETVKRLGGKL
ncbi:tetratricopeptide repeat protein [Chromobacterium sp. IIBBL 290-4]|uniref:tetratricopeptide repeat protein n=1 Tax=Chromobacterium sp. IIBBL 290-4 TaxID=2953890 RepID=UPI0020B6B428|nr:tetratricopeptide repeat protein [Chromobacterium sp. IIBBL 290-4]UTH76534.1 tetratricopeptide repeat protein [Chromobacterium sp. IIBBL 290-4]